MRKRALFTLLLCAAWALPTVAQNTVESIRKAYQNVHEWIGLMSDEFPAEGIPPEYFDLHVAQNLPGTGPHNEYIRMYYDDIEPEPSDDEEDFSPYDDHCLLFVTAKYNFAAREFYEEYLYDHEGNVRFIYAITPDVEEPGNMTPYELRMWFDGDRLLRFTAKRFDGPLETLDIATLKKGTFKEEHTGKTIPAKYEREASRCQLRAKRFLTMFQGIDDNTYL
ncbi:MAG: hypothetical protein K6G08_08065 [Prevotella sp.]|nr:hypothetical protein [Prevotella sp.]